MIRADEEEVRDVRPPVATLDGRAVDGAIQVSGELADRPGREDVGRGQRGVVDGIRDGREVRAGHAVEAPAPSLLLREVVGLRQTTPGVVVCERRHAEPPFVERPALAVPIVIGDADDTGSGVDQFGRRTVAEPLIIAEEDDRILPPEAGEGRRVVGRDRLGVTEATDLSGPGQRSDVRAQAQRLDRAGGGVDRVRGDLGAIVEDQCFLKLNMLMLVVILKNLVPFIFLVTVLTKLLNQMVLFGV